MAARRWPALALVLMLGIALAQWPSQIAAWRAEVWPVLRLWPDLDAQYAQQWGADVDQLLQGAARSLPLNAAVLLVTPGGADWRQTDYVAYHRALYWLAPLPVIWAAPFPPDGTWEARWHIQTALDPTALAGRATELGINCVLSWNVPASALPGQTVAAWSGGSLQALAVPQPSANYAEFIPPAPVSMWVNVARVTLGVVVILALGAAGLPLLVRLGHRLSGAEALALCWLAGAALVSTALVWLGAFGAPLNTLVVWLAVLSVPAGAWGLLSWLRQRRMRAPVAADPVSRRERVVQMALLLLITLQVAAVLVVAVGRPLAVWDSWVNWGLKARLIFLEQGVTPALYADPTRLVTHPDYPLLVPLLQAWLYAWVGAADDRWAGLPGVLFYLALLAGLHACLRRLGVRPTVALIVVAIAACLPALAGLTRDAYPDAIVAGLACLAAAYLLDWSERGDAASLAVAALCLGLLPWVKREGAVLALVLIGAAVVVAIQARAPRWPRRAVRVAASLLMPLLVLAGPWYVFTGVARVPNPDYGPITVGAYLQNASRLLYVGWRGLRALVEPRLGLIGPLAAVSVVSDRLGRRALGAAGLVGLGVPVVYLALVAQGYVFSDYAPFEAHVITSLERLVLHVSLLPVLWLALGTVPPMARPARMSAMALAAPRRRLGLRPTWALAFVNLGGLLVRLPALARDLHVTNDMETLRGWLHTVAERGLVLAYQHTSINYAPVYVYWLWLAGRLEPWLAHTWPALDAATLLIKLPALAADLLTAAVIGRVVGRPGGWVGVAAVAAYLFNPAVWYVSSYWGQVDGLYTLFLVLAVVVVQRPANWLAWLLFAVALSTKVQAVCLAPLLALAAWRQGGWRSLWVGGLVGTGTLLVLWAPWLLTGQWGVLRSSPLAPVAVKQLSVTAYNLWYLLRLGAVQGLSAARAVGGLPLSYQTLARLVYLAGVGGLVALVWRRRPLCVALLAAALALAFFVFMPDMRERYLFPVPALLLLALADEPPAARRWLWLAYAGLSLTWLFNLVTIASPMPGAWVNLVVPQPETPLVQALRVGALVVAALLTLLFMWLVSRLAPRRGQA